MDVTTVLGREPALSGMGDDGPYGYERYLRRKTVYLHYDGFGTPAELHP